MVTECFLTATRDFLKSLPRGWGNAYRDWGDPQVTEIGEREATVDFIGVAPYLFEHRQHWVAIEGVLIGLVNVANEKGDAQLSYDPENARVNASVKW